MRFTDGAGGNSIGYKDDVIFPLHVVPQDAGKPVTLRLKLDYAVCEKLCVPAEGQARADADRRRERARRRAQRGRGAGAEARGHRRQRHARDPRGPPRSGTGKPRVLVDVAAPAGAPSTLFAEGPTPDWALPLPEPVAGAPAGQQRFAFELDGLPPGEQARRRHAAAHGGRRRQGHRGRISSRLIRRRRAKFRPDPYDNP